MNENYLTLAQLEKEMQIVKFGNQISWARIGRILLSVEHHSVWQIDSRSYTDWIKRFSIMYGKSASSCWRFLSSSRYYLELKNYLHTINIEAPLLQDLSESVSPENLELLHKIERVLPSDEKRFLAEKVISGNIKRAELRKYWHYYKPLLNEANLRGNKYEVNLPKQSSKYQQELVIANILKSLSDSNGQWIYQNKRTSLTLTNLNLNSRDISSKHKQKLSFDVVTLIKDKSSDDLELHGIDVLGIKNDKDPSITKAKCFYFNYFWLAIHEDFDWGVITIPNEFGVVEFDTDNYLEIKKPAIKMNIDKENHIDILESIAKGILN